MTPETMSMSEYHGLMTEEELQAWAIGYAREHGWLVHAERPAWTAKGYRTPIQGYAGYVDMTAVRAGVVLFAEFKSAVGDYRPGQESWLMELDACPGVQVYIWRPADRAEIMRVLA